MAIKLLSWVFMKIHYPSEVWEQLHHESEMDNTAWCHSILVNAFFDLFIWKLISTLCVRKHVAPGASRTNIILKKKPNKKHTRALYAVESTFLLYLKHNNMHWINSITSGNIFLKHISTGNIMPTFIF